LVIGLAICLVILVIYLQLNYKSERGLLSFANIFIFSASLFLLSRPIMAIVLQRPIVEAGYPGQANDISLSIAYILIIIQLVILSYGIFYPKMSRLGGILSGSFGYRSRFLSAILFFIGSILGFIFLRESYVVSKAMLSADDYNQFSKDHWDHFKYFFMAKYFLVCSIIFQASTRRIIFLSVFLFLFSVGFILIGLRGYTFVYLALLFYFYFIFKEVKFGLVLLAFFAAPIVAGAVLEYRLGFPIYDSILEKFFLFFYQQGASFEVVYGATAYWSTVLDCIGYQQYLLGEYSFGRCVDESRGVAFVYGGYGTSYFAEVIYFPTLGFLCIVLTGFLLAVFDRVRELLLRSNAGAREGGVEKPAFVLFLVVPNIVYIARSDLFDFVWKGVLVLTLVFIASGLVAFIRKPKNADM